MYTYEARVIADQATGRPLAGVRVTVEDAETGAAVQAYRDGAPVQLVTGSHGLITEWQTEDTTRRVALTAGPVRLTQWCGEIQGTAADAVALMDDRLADAASAANQAATIRDGLEPRVRAVEKVVRTEPDGVTDGQVASVVAQPDTLTRSVLDVRFGGAGDLSASDAAPTAWSARRLVATASQIKGATGLGSLYFPTVLRLEGVLPDPPAVWGLWFSTDHEVGQGGTGLMYADDLAGPWTVHAGVVWRDPAAAGHTETPCVIPDPDGSGLLMLYHCDLNGGAQQTRWATSPDGVTWTYGGAALVKPAGLPGNEHTGYARAYAVGAAGLVAFSSLSGGDSSRTAMWHSRDGRAWALDRRWFMGGVDLAGDTALTAPFSPVPFRWRGQVWGTGVVKTPSSGGAASGGVNRPFVARMAPDLRGFVGPLHPLASAIGAPIVEHNGRLHSFILSSAEGLYLTTLEA